MNSYPITAEVSVLGLESFDRLDKTVKGLDESTQKFGKTWAGANKAMAATAKRLGKATKDVGRAAGRARVDLGDLATSFRDMGDFGTRAGDVIDQFSVITRGPMGLAVAGAVAGIAGLTVGFAGLKAAVEAGISTNRKANRSFRALITEGKRFVAVLGQIIIGGNEGATAIDSMTGEVRDFTKTLTENAVKIRNKVISIAQAVVSMMKFVGTGLMGIKAIFVGLGNLIAELSINLIAPFADVIGRQVGALLLKLRKLVMDFAGFMRNQGKDAGPLYEMANALSAAADTARRFGVEVKAAAGTAVIGAGFSGELQKIDAFRKELDGVNDGLERMRQNKVTIDTKGITDSLRTDGGKKGEFDPTQKTIGLAGLGGFLAIQQSMRAAASRAQDVDFARTVRKGGAVQDMAKLIEVTKKLRDALQGVADKQAEVSQKFGISLPNAARYIGMMSDLKDQMGSTFKDSIVETTGALSGFFGAFAAGESSLSAFGDAMADLAGNIAGTFGQLFVKMGVGMVLVNPAVGAGLIAAGVGLNMLGGAISSKGSANSGGGGGRGSRASATATVNRELARSLRAPERRGGRNETLVLQIGEEQIAATVRRVVNGQMRLNRIGRRSL